MNITDLAFGLRRDSLEVAKHELQERLKVAFEPRISSFRGGECFYAHTSPPYPESISLQRNEELDGEPAEPDFPAFPIILYVGGTVRPGWFKNAVSDLSDLSLLTERTSSVDVPPIE